jgi:hypothetical protein
MTIDEHVLEDSMHDDSKFQFTTIPQLAYTGLWLNSKIENKFV